MKRTRTLISVLLMLLLLLNVGMAEDSREFTADEQAYDAYLDITYAYEESVRILKEGRELWSTALSVDDVSDLDLYWFRTQFLTRVENMSDESTSRYMSLLAFAQNEYGFESPADLYDIFMDMVRSYDNKPISIVAAGMALAQKSGYVEPMESIGTYLDDAMSGIRTIMSIDREYPFVKDLQEYYKEAVLVYEYMKGSWENNFAEFSEKVDTYSDALRSWEIDFEFIFDPEGYDYVYDVRAAEQALKQQVQAAEKEQEQKALYNQAVALENSGDYETAIEYYQQCNYEDSRERIKACKYQIARLSELNHDYFDAAGIYKELADYEDSAARYTECTNRENYLIATTLENQGSYTAAKTLYETLDDFRDSKERAKMCARAEIVAPLAFGETNSAVTIRDFLEDNATDLPVIQQTEAVDYIMGEWYIYHFDDSSASVYSCTPYSFTEIGRFRNDGTYWIIPEDNFLTNKDDYEYSIGQNGIQSSSKGNLQFRKISDVFYVAYALDSRGEYSKPVYLANRVMVTDNGFINLCSASQADRALYSFPVQFPLKFAVSDNDTLETWYSSEENAAILCAALLVETGYYTDFQHYGSLSNTYITVYDGAMDSMLIGMYDHTLIYHYIPNDNAFVWQVLDGMVLTPEEADNMYNSWGCSDYKNISSDVWLDMFSTFGADEQGIIEQWKTMY